LFHRRITVHVHIKSFDGGVQFRDVSLRGADLRLGFVADNTRQDGGGENSNDDDHDHQFDEREGLSQVFLYSSFHFDFLQSFHRSVVLILKMGSRMAMTMNPMTAPTHRTSTGASNDTSTLVCARMG